MKKLLKQVGWVDKPWVTFEYGDLPYTSLWDDHDVLVAPEKFNGLSLPLQEGLAAGMVVVTSDRYPHNTWLPREYLVPVLKYQKARVNPSYMEFDEAIIEPMAIAETMDRLYGKDISGYSEVARNWA
jgi:glycosyltransferase involved in cell wall biosynthesis